MNFEAHNDEIRKIMLEEIGLSSMEDLFEHLPVKMKSLDLPNPLSEMEAQKGLKKLSNKNKTDYINFSGGGCYNKFVPAAISQVAQRFEFLTAYTPYQPEISQGTLQIMYEYQSMICMLTGMDVANASVYDGGSACAEAVSMACRISRKKSALVSNNLNPEYKEVVKTYAWGAGIDIEWFDELPADTKDYACVLVQNPDYYGEINALPQTETLLVVCTTPDSLSLLKPPVEADIVVGDIQTLGIPMSMGGPHAGFMACKDKYMRQLPGRLAGKTLDADGKTAYTLTLQTREQHIRREKATSNICSNQALIALQATLYLSLLGEKGFRQAGVLSADNAHLLSEKLNSLGIKTENTNFFNEFVIKVDNADRLLDELKTNGIIGGIKLSDNRILVCATEMNTKDEINDYIKCVQSLYCMK
ncbi:MAG: aminomethyl-transferring glycine dehydrogenase subunit GcvPA [Cyanobacteria bacterium RUI128]|nr:aminomethyl-transferring glycine dehydrogenase subunit GcvPA [Cyanobacteria bacterium RUI128]